MTGNTLVKSHVIVKPNIKIGTAVREASCSRGWLRIFVQYLFGAITVASFIMIVLMSLRSPSSDQTTSTWCSEQNCWIICNSSANYNYEGDIFAIASEAEVHCQRLSLYFLDLIFENGTMPAQWLSRIRSRIYKVAISRGNLRHISPYAFMSLFGGNIEILLFESISLTNSMAETFVGLSRLSQLYLKNCTLVDMQQNILQAVDDTLQILTITDSDSWNPRNITGGTTIRHIHTVDFSFNVFDSVLSNETFTGLKHCKILYLNSCHISAIGTGTFDPLDEIEIIYLNNNNLVTIPTGLFDGLLNRINPRPRLNLQDNPWHCDCSFPDFTTLYTNGLLYVDPTCHSPDGLHGQIFSAITDYCYNGTREVVIVDAPQFPIQTSINVVENYTEDSTHALNSCLTNSTIILRHSVEIDSCEKNITFFKYLMWSGSLSHITIDLTEGDWIKPSFMMKSYTRSMLQIVLTTSDYGILWFQSNCPNEIYCFNTMPKYLRVYDLDYYADYIFCPIELRTGLVKIEKCVSYSLATVQDNSNHHTKSKLVYTISIGVLCVVFGAGLVYGVILYNPVLLKGSKRIMFVKHKNVDALVLPPKIPLRNDLYNKTCEFYRDLPNSNTQVESNVLSKNFIRTKSTRSDKSSVSYISALHPTEDQLAEWRVTRHFDNNLTVNSELSIFNWLHDKNGNEYSSCSFPYESLK